jgi:hypothetical protein
MGYKVPHFISRIGSVTSGQFLPVMSTFAPNSVATESFAQIEMTFSGTFSDFQSTTRVANGTGTTTYTLRKNGADTAITWTIAQNATGQHGDSTNTVTFVSGDVFSIGITTSAGAPTELTGISFKIESDDGESRRVMGTYNNTTVSFSSFARFLRVEGELLNNLSTESTAQTLVHNDSVVEALSTNVTANTRTSAGTIVPRVNSISGSLSLSITASTAGRFTVSGGTTAVSVDDLLNTQITAGGSGTISLNYVAMTIRSDNQREISLMHGNNIARPATDTANDFNMVGNRISTSPTEAAYQVRLKSAGVLSRLSLYSSADTATTDLDIVSRIGGADGNQNFVLTSAGWFTDTTNSDTVADTDAISMRTTRQSVGSGTTTLRANSALFTMDAIVASTFKPIIMMF